jgi:hypothetical protein
MRFKDLYLKESSFGLKEYQDAIWAIINQLNVDLETIKKKEAKFHPTWKRTHEKNKENEIDSVKKKIKFYNYRLKNSKSVDEKTLKLWIDEFNKEYNYK